MKENSPWSSWKVWLAALLLGGYAVHQSSPRPDAEATKIPPVQAAAAPAPVKAQVPVASVRPAAVPPVAAPEKAAAKPSAASAACNCDTAETDLPDMCPNDSCRKCKATCGIVGN